ncbi:hypothetical protein CSAL01_06100, partial [Colletotrichum salicis]
VPSSRFAFASVSRLASDLIKRRAGTHRAIQQQQQQQDLLVERRDANLIQYADVIDRMDQGEQRQHAASNRPILMHLLSAPLPLLDRRAATLRHCLPRAPLPQWRFPSHPSARSHFYPNIDVTNATRKRPPNVKSKLSTMTDDR